MNTETSERAETKTFRLSNNLAVDITVGPGQMLYEWDPAMPKALTAEERGNLIKARDEMVGKLAEMVGGSVLVLTL